MKAADRRARRKRSAENAPTPLSRRPGPTRPAAPRIPWVQPIFETDAGLFRDIRRALASGRVTNDGPHVREFERRLTAYLRTNDCVAVSSGSAALTLVCTVLGQRGARVVIPSYTFIATLNAVVHAGMTPVFCDIEPDTWTLSPVHLEHLLAADPEIRLVVAVNVFGVAPDLPAIARLLRGSKAVLVLDNAHGMGTEVGGVRCAVEPAAQTYSFHATKTLPAIEGGAVVAPDPEVLARIRRMRNHGIAGDPTMSEPGYNAKMSELHAAVGLRSLQALDGALARRRRYAGQLRRVIEAECAPLFTPQRIPRDVVSSFQNLAVRCHTRQRGDIESIRAELERDGIETRRYFWPPLHQLPPYRDRFRLPATDEAYASILCLPLHSRMEAGSLRRIEASLRRIARARNS